MAAATYRRVNAAIAKHGVEQRVDYVESLGGCPNAQLLRAARDLVQALDAGDPLDTYAIRQAIERFSAN